MRRVCYVSGSRADFGLMQSTLQRARQDGRLDICVCVTGQHLLPAFGMTVGDIERSAVRIGARVPVVLDGSTGASMARAIGHELIGLVDAFQNERPDLVMVLGDRGEMLAGALAAMHLGIPVVHIHGGERSGTVDEPVRHAVSKLAHLHCVTTAGARERLIRMGEAPEHIFVTGAPGLDGLRPPQGMSREVMTAQVHFDAARPVALVVFHPVVQEADQAGQQMSIVLSALLSAGYQLLCLAPNSDAGGMAVREAIQRLGVRPDVVLREHLERGQFVAWMAAADLMVGNSSSGIIEAATLGVPVLNIGSRQEGRERNGNVIDVNAEAGPIAEGIARCRALGRGPWHNRYGDGRAAERIVELLATTSLDKRILQKRNSY